MGLAGALLGVAIGLGLGALLWRRRPPTDALTGLVTREAATRALASLRPNDVVVVLDIDDLKATNDQLGHAAGDGALQALAQHLTAGVRGGDTVARWGGDEFVLVLRDAASAPTLVVERLRQSSPVPFSAGVANTFAAADAALLAAKRAGGSRVVTG